MQMARAKGKARKPTSVGQPRAERPIKYADLPEHEWIAIRHDEIIAHASTLKELDAIVQERPDRDLVVFSRVLPRGPQVWSVH